VRAHLVFDFEREFGALAQEFACVVLALADALAAVAVPGAALFDHVAGRAEVEDLAFARRAFAVEDVELGRLERRRDLVLDDLLTRVSLPTTSSPFLIEPVRRMSSRTDE